MASIIIALTVIEGLFRMMILALTGVFIASEQCREDEGET
jgi:hypothetical protein